MYIKNLEIQKYIISKKNIEEANDCLSQIPIKVKTYQLDVNGSTHTVYIYNYDHIASPKDNSLANESRGLILDPTTRIVSFSFKRFFNFGDTCAAPIDWSTARAEQKYDGSLIVLYCFQENYFVQTREVADANCHIPHQPLKYCDETMNLLKSKFNCNEFSHFFPANLCFAFEFVAPYNKLVTNYDCPDLVLLSIFDKKNGTEMEKEFIDQFAKNHNLTRPLSFSVNHPKEVYSLINNLPDHHEGFVVVDKYFNRIKIKNNRYRYLFRLVNAGAQLSVRNFEKFFFSEEKNNILSNFPEFIPQINFFEKSYQQLSSHIHKILASNQNLSDKELAQNVRQQPLANLIFACRKKPHLSIKDILKPDQLINFGKQEFPDEYHQVFAKYPKI